MLPVSTRNAAFSQEHRLDGGWGMGWGCESSWHLPSLPSLLEVSETAQASFPFPPALCSKGRREIQYPSSMRIQAAGLLSLTTIKYRHPYFINVCWRNTRHGRKMQYFIQGFWSLFCSFVFCLSVPLAKGQEPCP